MRYHTVLRAAAAPVLAVAFAAPGPAAAAAAHVSPEKRVLVSAAAQSEHWAPDAAGSWVLEITPEWHVTARVGSRDAAPRTLGRPERMRLEALLAALPSQKPRYGYGVASELSTVFLVRVRDKTAYFVSDTLGEDAAAPEARPVLELLAFLHGLLESTEASRPPSVAQ